MEYETGEKKWRPIGRVMRRVAGVLVEKAKTTPDIYPMTINAIATGANQKSNRHPLMQLAPDDVDEALDDLREIGAVVEIQGDGRKSKYKHLLYEWLGVDKVELAVMAELLLRGQQTLGELRARASRMEKIEGLGDLKPIIQNLVQKQLVIELSPEGRGQIVTHGLYLPEELAKLEREIAAMPEPETITKSASPNTRNIDFDVADLINNLNAKVESLSERVTLLEQRLQD